MEYEIAKLKSIQYKIALSVVLIRNKPKDITLDQYLDLFRANFSSSFEKHTDQINHLKKCLLDAKKEIFYLKNKDIIKESQITLNDSAIGTFSFQNTLQEKQENSKLTKKYQELEVQFNSNLEFITNIVKLKTVDKNFKLNKEITEENIFDCLSQLLNQIGTFLFEYDEDLWSHHQTSTIITDSITDPLNQSAQKDNSTDLNLKISFPIESILHSLQLFLNVYEIEWLYYLRNKLIDQITLFVDCLIRYIIQFENPKQGNSVKMACCNQILLTLSTSDYLLNTILTSTINGIQITVDYLCDLNRSNSDQLVVTKKKDEIDNIANNCMLLCDCMVSIVNVRLLDNYTSLTQQMKTHLCKILNSIFINLTDSYPLIAIQLSKLIQLLAIQKN